MFEAASLSVETLTTRGGDTQYLRYLGVELVNRLPVGPEKKSRYRALIDKHPNHFTQKILFGGYRVAKPLVRLVHRLNYGQEIVAVARK
jgi:hypothetical protein